MIKKLFFKLLPIQIMIIAMSSINSIVDGAMAGRFIDDSTVGVVGLYFSMVNVLNAIGSILLGGSSVLCGRYMGKGDIEKTNNVFSVNVISSTIIGLIFTLFSFFFSYPLANILGANEALKDALSLYIRGYAIGIIPLLLGQQLASFLQLERQSKRSYIAIASMIISNIVADIVFVAVLKLGIFGLAIATSTSNIIYFLILGQYYFTNKSQLKVKIKNNDFKELKEMIIIGIPGALLIFCLAIRGLVINRILLKYGGSDALSAMSAFNMISGLLLAYCLGNGAVVRILTSIFVGEENKKGIKDLIKLVFTRGIIMSIILAVIVVIIAGPISSIFFSDINSNVYQLTKQITIIFGASLPLVLICSVNSNYLQARGHNLIVNIISIFDGFFSMVIPSLILAPLIGVLGVWLANPIGIILTMIITPIYIFIYLKHIPKLLDELLLIDDNFGVSDEDRLIFNIENINDVTSVAINTQIFCKEHNINDKTSYYAALSLEEMTSNVVEHGFNKDHKKHLLEATIIYKDNNIILRIKDDCIPFNPKERLELINTQDPFKNIGIKMVYKIADEVIYQNLIGLNILTIKFKIQ